MAGHQDLGYSEGTGVRVSRINKNVSIFCQNFDTFAGRVDEIDTLSCSGVQAVAFLRSWAAERKTASRAAHG